MRQTAVALGLLSLMSSACDKKRDTSIAESYGLPVDAAPATVPLAATDGGFACDQVTLHRAWRFRGESTLVPSAVADVAAVYVTTRAREGIVVGFADEKGERFDTEMQLVRADAKGAPLDRFHGRTTAYTGPLDVVAIGAVPKGTSKMKLVTRSQTIGDEVRCETPLTLADDGSVWPKLPRYAVTRFTKDAKALRVLVRAENVLAQEGTAPTLQWKPLDGAQRKDGVLVSAMRTGAMPTTIAVTNERGEPAAPDPRASSRWVVLEYDWNGDEIPQEYTMGDKWGPLPPSKPWVVSKELRAALDASAKIAGKYGPTGQAVFVHGGQTEIDAMAEAGAAPHW